MSRVHRSLALFVFLVAGALAAVSVRAGVNRWTELGRDADVVAADPRDPYVVYAVFSSKDLYRSTDGGRTWGWLAHFDGIYSLLVHPAAPDTLYMGASVLSGNGYSNLFKSTDGGVTWTRTPTSPYYEGIFTLVGVFFSFFFELQESGLR